MKVFVIDKLFSRGIEEVPCELSDDNYVYVLRPLEVFPTYLKLGREAFKTREEALTAANRKRDKKIASLKRQIRELQGMRWDK